ncbi:hypothetical protein [Comamonas aquatica]|uniref:hypothetical protein n=1 Tax=Comamonas aquatica TaxID=225991 RepID=UPI0012E071C4|nr:hypothetical protein [Comamonas aquatica]
MLRKTIAAGADEQDIFNTFVCQTHTNQSLAALFLQAPRPIATGSAADSQRFPHRPADRAQKN